MDNRDVFKKPFDSRLMKTVITQTVRACPVSESLFVLQSWRYWGRWVDYWTRTGAHIAAPNITLSVFVSESPCWSRMKNIYLTAPTCSGGRDGCRLSNWALIKGCWWQSPSQLAQCEHWNQDRRQVWFTKRDEIEQIKFISKVTLKNFSVEARFKCFLSPVIERRGELEILVVHPSCELDNLNNKIGDTDFWCMATSRHKKGTF